MACQELEFQQSITKEGLKVILKCSQDIELNGCSQLAEERGALMNRHKATHIHNHYIRLQGDLLVFQLVFIIQLYFCQASTRSADNAYDQQPQYPKIYMSCCPTGSWEQLHANYHPKGQDLNVEGVPVYHVGQGNKRVLLIISDIFGATSGRHRNVADIFASLHYEVFLPEILVTPYSGDMGPAIVENIKGQDQTIMAQNFQKVRVFLETRGVKQFFAVGFCWGVWEAFKLATKYDEFISIAGPHPSLGVEQMFGGSDVKLAEEIRCPAFFLPAKNDPPNVKPQGQIVESLAKRFGADKTGSVEFAEMVHGWVVRGDMENEAVARDVNKAIKLIHEYFSKF